MDFLSKMTSRAVLISSGINAVAGTAVENMMAPFVAGLPLGAGPAAAVAGTAYASIVTGRALADWMQGADLQEAFMAEYMCAPCLLSSGLYAVMRLARGARGPQILAVLPDLSVIDDTAAAVVGRTDQGNMVKLAGMTALSVALGSTLWEAAMAEPDVATQE